MNCAVFHIAHYLTTPSKTLLYNVYPSGVCFTMYCRGRGGRGGEGGGVEIKGSEHSPQMHMVTYTHTHSSLILRFSPAHTHKNARGRKARKDRVTMVNIIT